MNWQRYFDWNPPVDNMQRLTLGRTTVRVPLPRTWGAPLPTWGQIKKLTNEGEKMLEQTGQAKTATNLFLAMIELLSLP